MKPLLCFLLSAAGLGLLLLIPGAAGQPFIPTPARTLPVPTPSPTLPPVFTRPCELFPNDFSPEADRPWASPLLPCLERVTLNAAGQDLTGATGLATAPGGRLFISRLPAGDVLLLTDSDHEGAPDLPQPIAAGLDRPSALTFAADALYIRTVGAIYRWTPDALTPIVTDLPTERGFVDGGIAVIGDHLYVTIGAVCLTCPDPTGGDPRRGALLRYTLAGTDETILFTGLIDPRRVTAAPDGTLWIADALRDEILHVGSNGDLLAVQPFTDGSAPSAALVYTSSAIPALQGRVITALAGILTAAALPGFAVVAVDPAGGAIEPLLPANPEPGLNFSPWELNYRGSGFFPDRPFELASDERGWLYLLDSSGRVLLIRPHVPVEAVEPWPPLLTMTAAAGGS